MSRDSLSKKGSERRSEIDGSELSERLQRLRARFDGFRGRL